MTEHDDAHTLSEHGRARTPAGPPVRQYSPPKLAVLGTLQELTQKAFNASDGSSMFGVPEGNAS